MASHGDTRQRWAERVQRFQRSGLTQERFAALEGFSASSLRLWAKRLQAERLVGAQAPSRSAPKAPASGFIELVRPAPATASWLATPKREAVLTRRIESPQSLVLEVGRARVSVPLGTDPDHLAVVVSTLLRLA